MGHSMKDSNLKDMRKEGVFEKMKSPRGWSNLRVRKGVVLIMRSEITSNLNIHSKCWGSYKFILESL